MRFLAWLISKILIPFHRRLSKREIDFFTKNMFDGYLIVTHTPWQLSNLFIPKKWDHVGLITYDHQVIEATTKGVVKTPLLDVVKRVNNYEVFKPTFLNTVERYQVIESAEKFIGADYDFEFETHNKDIYCSELVFFAIKNVRKDFEVNTILNDIVLPSSFSEDPRFQSVISYKELHG